MFSFAAIDTVHVEMTDRCNAACPQCVRNLSGDRDNPYLANAQLSLAHIETIFPAPWLARLKHIYLCGNFGDAIVARDTLPALQYFRRVNPTIMLGLHTNGSARSPEWWSEVGRVMTTATGSYVKWGIDGLADTNALYRRHTSFDKIIENAKAFIAAGGNAFWVFIPFLHNEHQIEAARTLAASLGFTFELRKTNRFVRDHHDVYDKNGARLYAIKPATAAQPWTIVKSDAVREELPIACKVQRDGSVYVSAEGLVFPCCYTAGELYAWNAIFAGEAPMRAPRSAEMWEVIDRTGGVAAISALHHSVEAIVTGACFAEIEASWSLPNEHGKLRICSAICGAANIDGSAHRPGRR